MLYFAYGSNMDKNQMAYRCPNAVPVGKAELLNHKLIFRGYADVIPEGNIADSKVTGIVWKITKECRKALDRYEGWPRLYQRKMVTVIMDGKPVRAMMYYMVTEPKAPPAMPPSRIYWSTIMNGYYQFGLEPGKDVLKPNSNLPREEAESVFK